MTQQRRREFIIAVLCISLTAAFSLLWAVAALTSDTPERARSIIHHAAATHDI